MFSGIVEQKSLVISVQKNPGLMRLHVDLGAQARGLRLGASVAVAGVCLTVAELTTTIAGFDIMGETLAKTTLGELKSGDKVNSERSLKVQDEIGGHHVAGHVTGVVRISAIEKPPNNWIVTLATNPAWMPYIFPKGFIALDGCSLTIVDIGRDWFTVHLIPITLNLTTFGDKRVGDHINLELDTMTRAIVDTVKNYLIHQVS